MMLQNSPMTRAFRKPALETVVWEMLDGTSITFKRQPGCYITKKTLNNGEAIYGMAKSVGTFEEYQKDVISGHGVLAYPVSEAA